MLSVEPSGIYDAAYDIGSSLRTANLAEVNLSGARLTGLSLNDTNFNGADLSFADLSHTQLSRSTFVGADMRGADLSCSVMVGTDLTGADLSGCNVHGVAAWDVEAKGAIQRDLIITPKGTPTIIVDDLRLAQFMYLLVNNDNIRHIIDTITSKVVLILGRFTPERKAILDAIRHELRGCDYLPVLFDFQKPTSRDITETVSTLAHMARFVIADVTDARSIPQELMAIISNLPSVPVQPLLLGGRSEYGMFEHFRRYPWVLEPYIYEDQYGLLEAMPDRVIGPAEAMAKRQTGR